MRIRTITFFLIASIALNALSMISILILQGRIRMHNELLRKVEWQRNEDQVSYIHALTLNGQKVNPKAELTDLNNNQIAITDIVATKPRLFFRYSGEGCNDCILKEYKHVFQHISQLGKDNICIIAYYKYIRDLAVFVRNNKIECRVYLLPGNTLGTEKEEKELPHYFTLDRDFVIKNVFLPSRSSSKLYDEYFKLVEKLFANKAHY
jgi:ABC-type antimicrobial peptide transport system permease subunit